VPRVAQSRAHPQKKSLIATERDDRLRAGWRTETAALVPNDLLFLDETSTHTAFTRLRARAPKGARAHGTAPRNHGPNVTLLAVLGPTGILTSVAIPGATTRAVFDTFVDRFLAPRLRPGQAVILDNLAVHKSATAQARIEAAGGTARLPAALLPRLQPDRADLRQDQDEPARRCRPHRRRAHGGYQSGPRRRHRPGRRRLLRRLRLPPDVAC
jgi:hypothetical protein